jgi:hypothetical protein
VFGLYAGHQPALRATPHSTHQDLALKPADGPPKPSAPLARDTLSLLKRRPEPDVAASVLLEAGLLRLHEPLPVLRLGLRTDGSLPPTLEAAAQVWRGGTADATACAACAARRTHVVVLKLSHPASQALLASPPPDADAATRADLTTLRVYTIDDASTTEVDDGVSVERDAQGRLLLWVHVADPTRWLSPGAYVCVRGCWVGRGEEGAVRTTAWQCVQAGVLRTQFWPMLACRRALRAMSCACGMCACMCACGR